MPTRLRGHTVSWSRESNSFQYVCDSVVSSEDRDVTWLQMETKTGLESQFVKMGVVLRYFLDENC